MTTSHTRLKQRKTLKKKTTSSPRKKPSQSRSKETVAIILEAAARILEKDGLKGFNTNAVAIKAGVSVGSLYQYFPNKDSLTIALIQNFEDEMSVSLGEALKKESPSLRQSLREFIDILVEHHFKRESLNRILEMQEARLLSETEQHEFTDELLAPLTEFLKKNKNAIQVKDFKKSAKDLIVIARALCDSALLEKDSSDKVGMQINPKLKETKTTLERALLGYLLIDP